MSDPLYDCNCDIVLEMQELEVGVDEILQYARGVMGRDEIRALAAGLEKLLPAPELVSV